jgi:hypothetical protein
MGDREIGRVKSIREFGEKKKVLFFLPITLSPHPPTVSRESI